MKAGIIGIGHGSRVLFHAFELSKIEVYGISSKHYKKADNIRKKLKIFKVYKNWINLVADENIQIVAIAVPPKFQTEIIKQLKKKKIDSKVVYANRLQLFDIIRVVKEIILNHRSDEFYVNVASGSKIHSVGLMMACMIFDERSDIHPFYAQAKQYLHTKVSEPQTKGIKEIHHLPTYQIMTPKLEHLLALKIINENGGKIKKKDMAEKAEEHQPPLITVNARPNNFSQARFASLDKNIISPLEKNWKYIKIKKLGRTRWIELTDEGKYACEFLI